jgi:hypothetical protein
MRNDLTIDEAVTRRRRREARIRRRLDRHQRARRRRADALARRDQRRADASLAERALWWLAAFSIGYTATHVALLLLA